MARVVWSESAIRMLEDACRYVGYDYPDRARGIAHRIYAVSDQLQQFPLVGRIVHEFGREDIREVIVRPYRVVYRVKDDVVEIVAVRHGARLLGDIPGL